MESLPWFIPSDILPCLAYQVWTQCFLLELSVALDHISPLHVSDLEVTLWLDSGCRCLLNGQ